VRIAILGAGGLAREALAVAEAMNQDGHDIEPVGFIDVAETPGTFVAGLPVLGDESWFASVAAQGVLAAPAIGSPRIRRRSVMAVQQHGGAFTSLVHPTVSLGPRVRVGQGCLMLPNSSLTTDIDIESFVSINPGCTLGHDAVVGRFSNLSPGARLSGHVRIGAGVDIGAGAIVLPGLSVGDGSVLGAGAVAVRDVEAAVTVVGVPAELLYRNTTTWDAD
jgi:sugar O-acyltransferase (sialic acid O-acetyltransferase NeuD family)